MKENEVSFSLVLLLLFFWFLNRSSNVLAYQVFTTLSPNFDPLINDFYYVAEVHLATMPRSGVLQRLGMKVSIHRKCFSLFQEIGDSWNEVSNQPMILSSKGAILQYIRAEHDHQM
jgi:hypothetical protein